MKNMIFMFPGVGSHHVGMGKFFYDNFKIARDTFQEAGDTLKIDLAGLCFTPGLKDRLNTLENAQTALVTVSMATYRVFMAEVGSAPLFGLGHSLGEYSALCAAGIIPFSETLELVRHRGIILNRVASTMDGMMAWVINLDYKITAGICAAHSHPGQEIFISAYDSPVQSSISGLREIILQVGRSLEKEGAIVYPLPLSGPFHCPLMKEAAESMAAILQDYHFREPRFPVIANQNARCYQGSPSITENLILQLTHPILWQNSIRFLVEQGITTAVELGPDKVLKHLMKNNTDMIRVFSLENQKDLDMIKSNV